MFMSIVYAHKEDYRYVVGIALKESISSRSRSTQVIIYASFASDPSVHLITFGSRSKYSSYYEWTNQVVFYLLTTDCLLQ